MKIRGQTVYSPKEKIERLSMPEPNCGCWLWLASVRLNPAGLEYGRLVIGSRSNKSRRSVAAHRLAFEVYNGPILPGMNVLHKCDVSTCVNPKHLFLGTQKDNMQDCLRKGRIRNQTGTIPAPPAKEG